MALATPTIERNRVAVYPGAFDPVHLGHVDVATRAAVLFNHVIVAVFDRPTKPLTLAGKQRVELFSRAMSGIPNVEVRSYDGLTIDFARANGARFLIRGLRATSDFEYEYQMNTMNRHLEPKIETIFLMTSLEYAYLSSSLIKEVAAQGAHLKGLVPDFVAEALHRLYGPTPR